MDMKIMRFIKLLILAGSLMFCSIGGALAEAYSSGHQPLEIWDGPAMETAPLWLQYWLYFMTAVLAAGLLFVWRHALARWIVGGTILMIFLVGFVAPWFGIPVLAGLASLAHVICWSPGVYLALKQRPFFSGFSPFAIWSGLVTLVILISFIFDIPDSLIYLDHVSGLGVFGA
ncbi:MAG: hypothetical protein DHS20C08_10320 [Rhodomicrobium sp.]|nr:MAG: hypothetical protein DHS20C08_10320 [Rhodomicrobium sp.]